MLSLSPSAEEASQACAEVIRYLSYHSIKAESETFQVNEIDVMDMLLNKASDIGADLLVMGAQGQASLPFTSRGTGPVISSGT